MSTNFIHDRINVIPGLFQGAFGDSWGAEELREIADLVELARDALREGKIDEALALLDMALDAPDPDQRGKYEAWKESRNGASAVTA